MSTVAPTRQLLDPPGTLGVYPTTLSLSGLALALALVFTVSELVRGGQPLLLIVALTLFIAACLIVARSAQPSRAPFTVRSHFLAHATAVVAYVLSVVAAPATTERFLGDSWAAVGLGLLTIAIAPYRPVRELLAGGTISAAFIGFAAFAHAVATMPGVPPLAVATGTVLPLLAFCYSNATYSAATIRSLERSQLRADLAGEALAADLRRGIAQNVRLDRASILELDVVPFLSELLARDRIDVSDRRRAVQIADSVRRVMVAEADRTWLDVVLLRAGARSSDPTHAASAMDSKQRTSLRALINAAGDDPRADDLSVSITRTDTTVSGMLSIRVDAPESGIRTTYSPFFAVMRVAFSKATLDIEAPYLIVRFDL